MRAERDVAPEVEGRQAEASIYERLGKLLGLKSSLHSEIDVIERLERGLPPAAVESLRSRAGLTEEETYTLIAPRRTLERRESERQALSPEEADKTVRIARVTARAQGVFSGKPDYTLEWLRTPLEAIGGRTPLQALASESGARAVEELLIGIEHGMFA
jgi:putative toxin-antitoxin system antitoxin component (TIGR02293 family)